MSVTRVRPKWPYQVLFVRADHTRELVSELFVAERRWWKQAASCLGRTSDEDTPEDEAAAYNALKGGGFSLLWTDHSIIDAGYGLQSIFSLLPPASRCPAPGLPAFQLVNHLPGGSALLTKDGLLRSLNAAMSTSHAPPSSSGAVAEGAHPSHVFDICPTSFLIKAGLRVESNHSWQEFTARYRDVATGKQPLRMPPKHCTANLWVLKPLTGAGGTGVRIFADWAVLNAALRRREGEYLVQKLVERPLLLGGRKATLHTFVLITDTLDAYVWRGAYARLSSVNYELATADAPDHTSADDTATSEGRGKTRSVLKRVPAMQARWIHVTSTAAQNDCEDNEVHEAGNILSLRSLAAAVEEASTFARGSVLNALLPRIRRIVADAVRGAAPKLRKGCRGRRCFEILGADFVLDEDLRPWLIGMSECPSLDGPTVEHDANVRNMVSAAIAIAADPLCPAAMAEPRGDADEGTNWTAPPGPPTGPEAVAASSASTQRTGPPASPGGALSSPHSAAKHDVSGMLHSGVDSTSASASDPFGGFDIVFRVKDVPKALDPATDAEFDTACKAGPQAAAAILAAEAVSEAKWPPRANIHVPMRGLVPSPAAALGLRAWWRSGIGLEDGQLVEADESTLAAAAAASGGEVASVADPHKRYVAGAVRRDHSAEQVAALFPTDPSPMTRPARQATRTADRRAYPGSSSSAASEASGSSPHRSRGSPGRSASAGRPNSAALSRSRLRRALPQDSISAAAGVADAASVASPAAQSRAMAVSAAITASRHSSSTSAVATPDQLAFAKSQAAHRMRENKKHAQSLQKAANKASALLRDLRNKADAAHALGQSSKDIVSASTLRQLEGLAKRLAGEAKAATAASTLPARVQREIALSIAPPASSSHGRARSVGRAGTSHTTSGSPVWVRSSVRAGTASSVASAPRSRSVGRGALGTRGPGQRTRATAPSTRLLAHRAAVAEATANGTIVEGSHGALTAELLSSVDLSLPGERTTRRLHEARRAHSAHRSRIDVVVPRVDTGQRTVPDGLTRTARRVRTEAQKQADERRRKKPPQPTIPRARRVRGSLPTAADAKLGDQGRSATPSAQTRDGTSAATGAGAAGSPGDTPTPSHLEAMMTGTEFARHAAADGSEQAMFSAPANPAATPQSRSTAGSTPHPSHDSKAVRTPVRQAPRGRPQTAAAAAQRNPVDAAVAKAKARTPPPHAARPATQPQATTQATGDWQIWIETPAPASSSGGSVYYYRAADRFTQWERPEGSNVLVMTREEAAKHAEKSLGRVAA